MLDLILYVSFYMLDLISSSNSFLLYFTQVVYTADWKLKETKKNGFFTTDI